jgi:hypothetical protein
MEQAQTEPGLKLVDFIKAYISLISLLSTIFTAAVERNVKKQPVVHPIVQQPQRSK